MSAPYQKRALPLPFLLGRAVSSTKELFGTAQIEVSPLLNDEELIARLQVHDEDALNSLFGRYSRHVFGIASRILNDRWEAEDVVQEVFLYLYQKAMLFNPAKGAAKGWIMQIAFHRTLDRKAYLARRSFYTGTKLEEMGEMLLGDTDLDREIVMRLDGAKLQKVFDGLVESQRRTLELFFFEGMELKEIAEELKEPLGNVRHHYYRGLENLRKSAFVRNLMEK